MSDEDKKIGTALYKKYCAEKIEAFRLNLFSQLVNLPYTDYKEVDHMINEALDHLAKASAILNRAKDKLEQAV